MTRTKFDRVVAKALIDLRTRFPQALENMQVLVYDEPDQAGMWEGPPPAGEVQGAFSGDTILGAGGNAAYSGIILIFQGPVERASEGDDRKAAWIARNVVEHEVAHRIGLSEAQIAAAHHRIFGAAPVN